MIQLNNLCIGYHGRSIKLPSITGKFRNASVTAVFGNNGVGKSTFLKTLAGFLPPASGELKFSVCERPKISYFPQRLNVNYRFPLTVFDVVSMGCWPDIGLLSKTSERQKVMVLEALEFVKLHKMLKKDISILSVGQFQRMLFARLLVQQSSLILLDEPFNNVDNQTYDLMLFAIDQLRKKGSTVVVVLHDVKMVNECFFSNFLLLTQVVNIWT